MLKHKKFIDQESRLGPSPYVQDSGIADMRSNTEYSIIQFLVRLENSGFFEIEPKKKEKERGPTFSLASFPQWVNPKAVDNSPLLDEEDDDTM